jgi:pimeloyl-ACP methyl ester carboxylesterase
MLRIASALRRYAAAASLAAALLPEASAAQAAEAYAHLPAGRVFYLDSGGDGAAVVFLHARSGNSLLFEKQVEPFSKAGYRLIAFDRVGQGRSTRASTSVDARPELEQLMDHLGVARFHLVGVAAGGGVVLEYVLAHPQRVASITIANSIGNVQDPDYLALGRRLRPPEFERLPLELRELGPSYRAAHPEGVTSADGCGHKGAGQRRCDVRRRSAACAPFAGCRRDFRGIDGPEHDPFAARRR